VTRWELERLFDPETAETHPIPEAYQVCLLTSSQLRRLSPDERHSYLAKKQARAAWARTVWLTVGIWGAFKRPHSEWRYDEEKCREWGKRLRGKGETPPISPDQTAA
jgi:hypothetical protein